MTAEITRTHGVDNDKKSAIFLSAMAFWRFSRQVRFPSKKKKKKHRTAPDHQNKKRGSHPGGGAARATRRVPGLRAAAGSCYVPWNAGWRDHAGWTRESATLVECTQGKQISSVLSSQTLAYDCHFNHASIFLHTTIYKDSTVFLGISYTYGAKKKGRTVARW